MNSFFYRVQKKNSYTLRPMEPNSLKCSNMQTVNSIELKFGRYITGHRWANSIDFGEYRINSFLTGVQKRTLIHYGQWSQIL